MTAGRDNVEVYLNTVERMEPNICPVDLDGAAASIAISLRRIADALEEQTQLVKRSVDAAERMVDIAKENLSITVRMADRDGL